MWKAVLAGTAALTVAGSTLVYAQQRGPRPESFRRGPPSAEETQAFANARLAALRAGLSLTPEQQANWPAFEEAARELQKLRLDRMHAMIEQRRNPRPQSTDPAERMRSRGAAMADMGAALKKLADAVDPLYKSLDDNQKRRFGVLSRLGDPREAFALGGRDDDRRDGRGDRDFGRGREFRGERERRDFRDGPDMRGDRFGRDFRDDRDFRDRGDRFGGRDFRDGRDGPDFRGDRFERDFHYGPEFRRRFGRDFRDGPDFRGDRGDRFGRDFRGGRDFRDDRDFRGGGRNFRGRDDERDFRNRDDRGRGFRDSRNDDGPETRGADRADLEAPNGN
jgi:zinc resistance-associated protein